MKIKRKYITPSILIVGLDPTATAVCTTDPKEPIVNNSGEGGIGGTELNAYEQNRIFDNNIAFTSGEIDFGTSKGTIF